jgi:hypothetical protein
MKQFKPTWHHISDDVEHKLAAKRGLCKQQLLIRDRIINRHRFLCNSCWAVTNGNGVLYVIHDEML